MYSRLYIAMLLCVGVAANALAQPLASDESAPAPASEPARAPATSAPAVETASVQTPSVAVVEPSSKVEAPQPPHVGVGVGVGVGGDAASSAGLVQPSSLQTRTDNANAAPATLSVKHEGNAPRPWFAVGAGIGVGYANDPIFLGWGSVISPLLPSGSPFGIVMFEVAGSPRWRSGLNFTASYQSFSHAGGQSTDGAAQVASPREQSQLGAALSVRWVVNPGGIVEVSPLLGVGVHHSTMSGVSTLSPAGTIGTTSYSTSDIQGDGVDGALGLVLERELTTQLYLRLESYFARAVYSYSKASTTQPSGSVVREHWNRTSVSFGWQPTLALRFAF